MAIKQLVVAKADAEQETATVSRFKLPGGASLFITEDGDEQILSFEDASWDFDQVESCLNIFGSIPKQNVLTRSLTSSKKTSLLWVLNTALDKAPVKKLDVLGTLFTKDFAKNYKAYIGSLQAGINKLQDLGL